MRPHAFTCAIVISLPPRSTAIVAKTKAADQQMPAPLPAKSMTSGRSCGRGRPGRAACSAAAPRASRVHATAETPKAAVHEPSGSKGCPSAFECSLPYSTKPNCSEEKTPDTAADAKPAAVAAGPRRAGGVGSAGSACLSAPAAAPAPSSALTRSCCRCDARDEATRPAMPSSAPSR